MILYIFFFSVFVVYNIYNIYIFFMYITLLTSTSTKMQAHKTSTRKRRHSHHTFFPWQEGRGEGGGREKNEKLSKERRTSNHMNNKKNQKKKKATVLKFFARVQLLPKKHFTLKAGKNRKLRALLRGNGAKTLALLSHVAAGRLIKRPAPQF